MTKKRISKSDRMIREVVYLPEEVYSALKLFAKERGRSFSAIEREIIVRKVGKIKKVRKKKKAPLDT